MSAFWIACLGLATIGLPDGSLGVAWPGIRTGLSLPQAALGLILISTAGGTFCAGLVSGKLLQARGSRSVLGGAAILAACALLVIAASATLPMLCAGGLLLGFGLGSIDSGLNALAALTLTARRINWVHGWFGVGAMAGPLAMTAIIVEAGQSWRVGYICLAAALACTACLFERRDAVSIRASAAGEGRGGAWTAARHPLVQLQVVLFFVYAGVEITLGQWSYSILTGNGTRDSVAGVFAGAYWGSIAVGRFVSGIAIDHLGADRLLRCCTIAIVAGALAFTLAHGIWAAGGLVLSGLALAPMFPTLMARAPERVGASVALHSIGFKVSAAMVGGAVFPALGGLLADSAGLAAIGWCATGASCLLLILHEALLAASPRPENAAPIR